MKEELAIYFKIYVVETLQKLRAHLITNIVEAKI